MEKEDRKRSADESVGEGKDDFTPPDYHRLRVANSPEEIVYFDTETTGLSVERDKIIEYGGFVVTPDQKIGRRLKQYVRASFVSPGASETNHLTVDMLKDAPEFKEIAWEIKDLMDGRIWAGYNIRNFDVPLLLREFSDADIPPPTCAGTLDVFDKFKEWGLCEKVGNLKLDSVGRYFGFPEETHDALDDAQLTYWCFLRVHAWKTEMHHLASPGLAGPRSRGGNVATEKTFQQSQQTPPTKEFLYDSLMASIELPEVAIIQDQAHLRVDGRLLVKIGVAAKTQATVTSLFGVAIYLNDRKNFEEDLFGVKNVKYVAVACQYMAVRNPSQDTHLLLPSAISEDYLKAKNLISGRAQLEEHTYRVDRIRWANLVLVKI